MIWRDLSHLDGTPIHPLCTDRKGLFTPDAVLYGTGLHLDI